MKPTSTATADKTRLSHGWSTKPEVQDLEAAVAITRRLEMRSEELKDAVFDRVRTISPSPVADGYRAALQQAISGAVEFAFDSVARGPRALPPPDSVIVQARLAARSGIGLDGVLRGYSVGSSLFNEYLVEEAEAAGLHSGLKRLISAQGSNLDRLLEAVACEYVQEAERPPDTPDRRRLRVVQKLLNGQQIDPGQLGYNLDTSHLAIVGSGPASPQLVRRLSSWPHTELLFIRAADTRVWAWLGGRRLPSQAELQEITLHDDPDDMSVLAFGEPGEGFLGWRCTHHQAQAALPVAERKPQRQVFYADVALLAAALGDADLARSLRSIYLVPLEAERDGGQTLRETLTAYFQAERNQSSAAALMGVNRRTIANRLRVVEEHLGRALSRCSPEMEVALNLLELGEPKHAEEDKGPEHRNDPSVVVHAR